MEAGRGKTLVEPVDGEIPEERGVQCDKGLFLANGGEDM